MLVLDNGYNAGACIRYQISGIGSRLIMTLITGGTEALLVEQIVREGTNGQQADERNSRTAMWPL